MPLYVLETLGLDQLRICKFGLELISKPERKCHIQIILNEARESNKHAILSRLTNSPVH